MVLGLLAITSIPTVTGVAFATSEQRKANQRKEDARRMIKFNIDAECDGDTDDDRELHGRRVVVRNEKVSFNFHRRFILHGIDELTIHRSTSTTRIPQTAPSPRSPP